MILSPGAFHAVALIGLASAVLALALDRLSPGGAVGRWAAIGGLVGVALAAVWGAGILLPVGLSLALAVMTRLLPEATAPELPGLLRIVLTLFALGAALALWATLIVLIQGASNA